MLTGSRDVRSPHIERRTNRMRCYSQSALRRPQQALTNANWVHGATVIAFMGIPFTP